MWRITPPTRDGGIDASIKYKMGILEADGIVSAKHWHATVPPAEVQKIRGGMSDKTGIAIIVTTAEFSKAAKDEAARQDARKVCLIDGNKLVDICKSHQIGVREHPLPKLLLLDIEITQGSSPRNGTEKSVSTDSDEPDDFIESDRLSRLRDEMLSDPDKCLSPKEIAELTEYSLNTVRAYLSDSDRRKTLGDSIREVPAKRKRALNIISQKRKNTSLR